MTKCKNKSLQDEYFECSGCGGTGYIDGSTICDLCGGGGCYLDACCSEHAEEYEVDEVIKMKRREELRSLVDQGLVIWCSICEDHIHKVELRRWTGDDALHYLCPGCGSDLLPVQTLE